MHEIHIRDGLSFQPRHVLAFWPVLPWNDASEGLRPFRSLKLQSFVIAVANRELLTKREILDRQLTTLLKSNT
jgi:hypothetical protein